MKLKLLLGIALLGCASVASAQDWPNRPVRLIVPYGAGSGPDAAVRPLAENLSKILGQPVVVENYASAGGVVGTQNIARAKPDGYTLGFGNNITLAVNKSFFDNLSYDPIKSFEPISLLFENAYMLVARPDFQANSLKELVTYAKANPGKVNFASGTGVGSGSHLTGEMLKSTAKLDITHVPYKTGAQALSDLVSGRVDIMFDNVNGVQQFITNKTLKPLAVTSAQRIPQYPDVPTMAESGFPGFEAVAWGGIIAPAGTPKPIIAKMNAAIAQALKNPDVVKVNETMSLRVIPSTPEQFTTYIASETDKWAKLVKASGAKASAP